MKFSPHFVSLARLLLKSMLLIIAAATNCPLSAATLEGKTPAERYVLDRLRAGEVADLRDFSPNSSMRELSAAFIGELLTNHDVETKILSRRIAIRSAEITGELDLSNQEIPYDLDLQFSTFQGRVNLSRTRFAEGLDISRATFEMDAIFTGATLNDFEADFCNFAATAWFSQMQVRQNFNIYHSTFNNLITFFDSARVGGWFYADKSKFISRVVSFSNLRVDGIFSAKNCAFRFDKEQREGAPPSQVTFTGAHFTDFFLNESTFEKISTLDFTRLEADFISFDGIEVNTPTEVKVQRMAFKLISPAKLERLQFLLDTYNAEIYTDLENSFRTHGYPDEADKIFIAKKRAERRENCKSFLQQCNRVGWASSMFQDALAGYGKRLQNLLYWSVGFLAIGTLVFRNEKGMRPKDWDTARHYVGRYHPFWYSLDLFLPIIKLGEADVWTPKDNRRGANLYKKVHIIIGSLFVPIGLAAWTGIIK